MSTRNSTSTPESKFAGSLEASNPRSTANWVEVPINWTKPAIAARTKPRLSPDPNKPLERMRHRLVKTRTAPIATTSRAIATGSKEARLC